MADEKINGDVIRYTTKELLQEIRDGIHTLKSSLAGHELRIADLERRLEQSEKVREELVPNVESLLRDLEVTKRVATEVKAFAVEQQGRSDRGFTRFERGVALLLSLCVIALQAITLYAGN